MKLSKLLLHLVVFCCYFFCSSIALANDTTAPDNPTTTPPYTFDPNDGTITNPGGGCPGGTSAMMITEDGTGIRFGECVNTFAISYAINQALQGSGVSIDKVHYKWKYIHCFNTPDEWCSTSIENRVNTTTGAVTDDTYWDELVVVIELTDANGNVVETETWTMDRWYDWQNENGHSFNEEAETWTDANGQQETTYWQIHEDNIELYNHIDKIGTIYTPNALGDIRFRITGYDKGNWDGYFGPIMKDLQTWFTYRANPCNDTALYDPSCPGYAEAYATYEYDTNCSANALYDPGCPGYSQAYYNDQCQQDPLYDSGCNGYDSAYYTQQCNADATYDPSCPGYAQAYEDQQCAADSQYSYTCEGYNFPKETDAAMNVSGAGSDYIFIYRPNNPEQFDTLMADIANITNWVWGCEKSNGDECPGTLFGGIKDYMWDGGDYLFLYTIDKDDEIVYPDSGRWYSFIEYDYWYGSCAADINYDDSCSEYTRIQEESAQAEYDSNCSANPLYDSGCPGYAQAYEDQQCSANPLYSTNCSGYQAAYYDQQCSADPLYDTGCPGYSTAYYNQQCSADATYDSGCPGYETAYYNQQCSLDPLYDSGCPGYAGAYFTQQCEADPLYSPECSGYDTAYYNQQCSADPLYDTGCPGYATAYYNYQCEADPLYDSGCSGYDTAYFNQQCTANTLYNSECPGYDTAYLNQQCSLDTLYDSSCPGYEGAYFTQQCEADALYDIRCPGYDIAYFNQQCLQNPQYDTQCIGYVEPVVATPTPTPSSSVVVEGTGTGDAIVDSVIATPPPVIIIPVVPVAPPVVVVPVTPAPEPEAPITETPVEVVTIETIEQEVEAEIEAPAPEPEPEPEVQEPEPEPEVVEETIEEPEVEETTDEADEPAEENNNEETTEEESSGDVEQPVDGDETEEKDTDNGGEDDRETSEDTGGDTTEVEKPVVKKQLTAKQKQKAKERKMRKIIKEKLMQLAEVMGNAASLQEQQALQAQISALINYVPGFNAYGQLAIPGRDFYGPGEFYDKDKKVPENNRGLLNGLASQILHEKMVDEQYKDME